MTRSGRFFNCPRVQRATVPLLAKVYNGYIYICLFVYVYLILYLLNDCEERMNMKKMKEWEAELELHFEATGKEVGKQDGESPFP